MIGPDRGLQTIAVVSACLAFGHSSAMAGATFRSGGADYAIERFPTKPDMKPRKVVLLVHGTDGLEVFGPRLRRFAGVLEKKGYLVVLPNYFGTNDNAMKNGTPDQQVERLADAIEWARNQPDADKDRVGLVGYSLGSALSLVYAERNPGKIKALVDNYGPTDQTDPRMSETLSAAWRIVDDAAKLPPTLILHNKGDLVVDMKRHSEPLIAALRKAMIKSDFIPYDDGDRGVGFHPFVDGGSDDLNSKDKAIEWLGANL